MTEPGPPPEGDPGSVPPIPLPRRAPNRGGYGLIYASRLFATVSAVISSTRPMPAK